MIASLTLSWFAKQIPAKFVALRNPSSLTVLVPFHLAFVLATVEPFTSLLFQFKASGISGRPQLTSIAS
jgi:hypothetical protein